MINKCNRNTSEFLLESIYWFLHYSVIDLQGKYMNDVVFIPFLSVQFNIFNGVDTLIENLYFIHFLISNY